MYLPVQHRSTQPRPAPKEALSGEAFAAMINHSGRRRFTSQRVILYAILAAGGNADAIKIAEEALEMFQRAHAALVQGGNGLPGIYCENLRQAYYGSEQGNAKILQFIDLAQRALYAIAADLRRQIPGLLDELVASSTPLLAVLNSMTAIYEQEARAHAKEMEQRLTGAMNEIRTISKQAQVVAMNARIVAARAGSAGNEFAVVATELIAMTHGIETVLQAAVARAS